MKKVILIVFAFVCAFSYKPANAQLLKKIKDKANRVLDKKVDDAVDQSTGNQSSDNPTDNGTGNTSGKPTNKGGGGLKNTAPPDVNQQLADAEQAHGAGNYSDARYSLQQALMSIEIQLGREMLRSLPETVVGLPKDTTQDKVMSTQWGWSNLTMQRIYTDGKDKQLTVTIGNNGLYAGLVNVYFNNAYAVQANNEDQNFKNVKVKGNKAVIQYDDSKGYTLLVPLGQTSLIAWECINFADEDEVMNAANTFDIDGIKKRLGEQ